MSGDRMNLTQLKRKIRSLPARTEIVVSIEGEIYSVVECEYFKEKGQEYDKLVLCFLPDA